MSRHTLANILRNLAVILERTADRIDPQPMPTPRSFTVQSGNGTTTWKPNVTWTKVP